jgi:alpha-L-fucosidase
MFRNWSVALGVITLGVCPAVALEFRDQLTRDAVPDWEVKDGAADAWSVVDGVLHCAGRGGGWIGTKASYTDFIVELEFKVPPGGNSGVYLRATREGAPSAVAMEAQILDDTAEKHKNIKPGQHCGSLYMICPPSKDASKPVGEWNRMRVMCDSDHVVIWLNGERIVDANGRSHPEILKRSRAGAIGLQNHSTELWFRNIRVADLAADRARRTKWWQQARFGMFIHWGPVSIKGTEIGWSRGGERRGMKAPEGQIPVEVYDNLYKEFNPTKFNASEWVEIAKAAGMRYMVFTTKHHDGFCEFDSKLTDYKITNSPFKRDIVGELAAAAHEARMPIGFYYSPPDWHHPDYRTERHQQYINYLHGQLRELCSNYGKVAVIWFDGLGGTAQDWASTTLFEDIFRLQPDVIINNRAGLAADFDTPEQEIGKFQNSRLWESCITICQQWAYKPNDAMKSLKECIQTLVRCAGGDGNLLFNVGPMPTGEIEPRQVERLKEMGQWLSKYGESIYDTRGGPFLPGSWGASTYRGNKVYVHVLEWGGESKVITLPAVGRKIIATSSLTGDAEVKTSDQGIEITSTGAKGLDSIVVLELDGPAADIKPIPTKAGSLASGKKVTASNVFQNNGDFGPEMAVDDNEGTRWATDAGTHAAWLEVDLGEPMAVGRVIIHEALDRVKAFELQHKDGDQWQTIFKGTRIGAQRQLRFKPVTARFFRLNITQATEGPTIWEFQLFTPAK